MPIPDSGLSGDARLRYELLALLRGTNTRSDAHTILDGVPPERINERVDGIPYSLWDLTYHLWYTQHDILVFSINPDYEEPAWPSEYWPSSEGTPESWTNTTQAFHDDLDKLIRLVESQSTDLLVEFDHAPGYTLLREALV